MEQAKKILQDEFKLKSFRSYQEGVMQRLLEGGQSALAIMPTGSGKSLCYQIPALCLDGLTLVISPLLALMKDQVDALVRKGIKAGRMDSSQSLEEYQTLMDSLRSGELKLLYVAPERLNMEGFMRTIREYKISLLAVDESHCVAEWGNAFRPDYLKIARFADEYSAERVLCLTATATPSVAEEICRAFSIDETSGVFRATTYRSNLKLTIQSIGSDPLGSTRLEMVVASCRSNPGTTIVYITSQKNTEAVATHLCANRIEAKPYHAGLSHEIRKNTQEWFMKTPNAVICGTIAFGMGIDHATIRNVIHFNVPKTLEGYSQEVGRAGRDGLPSNCTLFLCQSDRILLENFARGNTPSRKSVKAFTKRVCQEGIAQQLGVHGVLVTNNYELEREYDIREVTLSLLFAQLELRFGLLRSITPMYTNFEYKEPAQRSNFAQISKDTSPASLAIRRYAAHKKTWYHVDATGIAKAERLDRNDVVGKLNEWSNKGWIELKASQRRNRYLVLKAFPTDSKEIEEIGDQMFEQLEKREKMEVQRMEKVFSWAADYICLPRGLADYFGDTDSFPDPDVECGQCTVCTTGGPISIYHSPPTSFNEYNFNQILKSTQVRDDARFLARVAFGIISPRVTAERLSSSSVFGSMQNEKFDELVQRFQVEVDKWESEHPNGATVAKSSQPGYSQKRKFGGTSSRGGSRGGYAKRGRY